MRCQTDQRIDNEVKNYEMSKGQGAKPYNAGPDALLLNHQSVILHVMPDAARPGQVRVSMEPALDEVRLQTRIQLKTTGACGDWREAMNLDMRPASGWTQHGIRPWVLSVQGPYPAACGAKDWPVLWQGEGPGDYAARLLHATWLYPPEGAGGKLLLWADTWRVATPVQAGLEVPEHPLALDRIPGRQPRLYTVQGGLVVGIE